MGYFLAWADVSKLANLVTLPSSHFLLTYTRGPSFKSSH